VAKLKKVEQEEKTMEEFLQEFRRTAKESGYEGRLLIKEFKRGMNGIIRRKLMDAEHPTRSIEQWYERAVNLDRNWRKSRREKERLRERREMKTQAPRQNITEAQWQQLPQLQVWPSR